MIGFITLVAFGWSIIFAFPLLMIVGLLVCVLACLPFWILTALSSAHDWGPWMRRHFKEPHADDKPQGSGRR